MQFQAFLSPRLQEEACQERDAQHNRPHRKLVVLFPLGNKTLLSVNALLAAPRSWLAPSPARRLDAMQLQNKSCHGPSKDRGGALRAPQLLLMQ